VWLLLWLCRCGCGWCGETTVGVMVSVRQQQQPTATKGVAPTIGCVVVAVAVDQRRVDDANDVLRRCCCSTMVSSRCGGWGIVVVTKMAIVVQSNEVDKSDCTNNEHVALIYLLAS
jgi:hypothetical protein